MEQICPSCSRSTLAKLYEMKEASFQTSFPWKQNDCASFGVCPNDVDSAKERNQIVYQAIFAQSNLPSHQERHHQLLENTIGQGVRRGYVFCVPSMPPVQSGLNELYPSLRAQKTGYRLA
jgi:ABC-type hemin transport system ATPase subunit